MQPRESARKLRFHTQKSAMSRLQTLAPAKLNLTLAVLAQRSDGYHDLSSLVAFADVGDTLSLTPAPRAALSVSGPLAAFAGAEADNLVLKAAHAAQARIEGLTLGRFELEKRLPSGAGLGGGSADAGAALRLIAQANQLDLSDVRLMDAARAAGADVPVCLETKARLIHGIGDVLSAPLDLPKLDTAVVFPGVVLATKDVFANFTLAAGPRRKDHYRADEIPTEREALIAYLAPEGNDLELAARLAAPVGLFEHDFAEPDRFGGDFDQFVVLDDQQRAVLRRLMVDR